ncbi:MAG: hypothetical protein WBD95_28800 [Xanthobacteraceae bacterium]
MPSWTKTALRTFGAPRSRLNLVAAGLSCAMLATSAAAALSDGCKPNHPRPLIILKDMGACGFDPQTLSFSGEPAEQAKCLMRGMDASRNLGRALDTLPPALASRVGQDSGLPAREVLSAFLSKQNLEWDFAAYLWQPLSRARDNDPDAPMARYFVIHDTSGPSFGRRSFPSDIDVNPKINSLAGFKCADGWGKAHVVINRSGDMLLDHELSVPWRETKFERAVNFAGALKGLFLHVEMIQPRRSAGRWRNDAQPPDPSFTTAQYDRLALLYVIASVRAGRWLVPAFHAAIDADIRNGHDDPLNFDVQSFANGLDGVMAALQTPKATPAETIAQGASNATPRPDSPATDSAKVTEGSPSPDAAVVEPEAAARRLVETSPQTEPEPAVKRVPPAANVNDTGSDTKHRDREAAGAEHCEALVAKGHRRVACRPHVAESRARGRRAHLVRAVDRLTPDESRGARHSGGDVHPRHARGAPRHNRA